MDISKGRGIQGIFDDTHFTLLQSDIQLGLCRFRVFKVNNRGMVGVDAQMTWSQFPST